MQLMVSPQSAWFVEGKRIAVRAALAAAARIILPFTVRPQAAFVADVHPVKGLLVFAALSAQGITPILGSKSQHRAGKNGAEDGAAWPSVTWDEIAPAEWRNLSAFAESLIGTSEFPAVWKAPVFSTSGSTGDGVLVPKSWEALGTEARFLAQLTGLTPGALVLALVPPFHIYGFLHGFLLSALAGADTIYAEYQDGVLVLPEAMLADVDLALAVPAVWPVVRELMLKCDLDLIVSSGAPWDAAREADFLETRRALSSRTRLFDVLGSTETGGLAWRDIGAMPASTFKLFSGVEIRAEAEKSGETEHFAVRSPYAEPANEWIAVADRFAPPPAGLDNKQYFVYRGRQDRIVKIGGRRVSLAEVERQLANAVCELFVGEKNSAAPAVRCRFSPVEGHSKGGELLAYVALADPALRAQLSLKSLRAVYFALGDLPFPNRLFLFDQFKLNAAGKISLPDLEANTAILT